MSTHTKRYLRDLFGPGMASRLAVPGYVMLICLGSLVVGVWISRETRVQQGQTSFVSLSVLVVVAEPTHDDDICKVCRDE
jgi:hypothetical protein